MTIDNHEKLKQYLKKKLSNNFQPKKIDSFNNDFNKVIKSLSKQKKFETMDEAQARHYKDLTDAIKKELENKIFFRKLSIWFMLGVVTLHFLGSILLLYIVIKARICGKGDIISDNTMIYLIVTLMVNFLASFGIILKYVFSSTNETYSHIEKTALMFRSKDMINSEYE
ncbi:hypothetical protein HMPREF9394_1653 [Streptococcus sanguinis SK1057]|uniref:hypothetical protein n=1 Tax=Streptococcus sanguinis TaxID=1305 RepID=UPI000204CD5F|nr:hypothetical protein [Streptococcus sanguinis]EGF04942.1 hypothetical protein HMPREF9394_1653 [Streptococcus sanguinis SK1057]